MPQMYSDPSRADDPPAMPDIEIWQARPIVVVCEQCGNTVAPWGGEYDMPAIYCPQCGEQAEGRFAQASTGSWWWWSCFPGCLPDSDPFGPYATQAEAEAAALADG